MSLTALAGKLTDIATYRMDSVQSSALHLAQRLRTSLPCRRPLRYPFAFHAVILVF